MLSRNRVRLLMLGIALIGACERRTGSDAQSAAGVSASAANPTVDTVIVAPWRASSRDIHVTDIRDVLTPEAPSFAVDLGTNAYGHPGAFFKGGFLAADEHQIAMFDLSGRLISKMGRKGEGPGEFDRIQSVCRTAADSIVVNDVGLHRVSILSPELEYVRSFRTLPYSLPIHGGCLTDGTLVTTRWLSARQRGVRRFDRLGTKLPADVAIDFDNELAGLDLLVDPVIAAKDSSIVFGNPWRPEIRVLTSTGALQQVYVLRGLDERPLPDSPLFSVYPQGGRRIVRPAKAMHLPFYRKIRFVSNGDVWYEEYPNAKHVATRWNGFNARGESLGALTINSAIVSQDELTVVDFSAAGVLFRANTKDGATVFRYASFAALRGR
ncbi:MAG: hypothetical protein ACO1Q7_09750 [Gemmatimonas sp.]